MMDHGGILIGSMAHPESAKRRWLTQFVNSFTTKGTLQVHFSAGGMIRI
jgi:hypothetical protein